MGQQQSVPAVLCQHLWGACLVAWQHVVAEIGWKEETVGEPTLQLTEGQRNRTGVEWLSWGTCCGRMVQSF